MNKTIFLLRNTILILAIIALTQCKKEDPAPEIYAAPSDCIDLCGYGTAIQAEGDSFCQCECDPGYTGDFCQELMPIQGFLVNSIKLVFYQPTVFWDSDETWPNSFADIKLKVRQGLVICETETLFNLNGTSTDEDRTFNSPSAFPFLINAEMNEFVLNPYEVDLEPIYDEVGIEFRTFYLSDYFANLNNNFIVNTGSYGFQIEGIWIFE